VATTVIKYIKTYFYHEEHDLCIEPSMCLIHKNFDQMTHNLKNSELFQSPASGETSAGPLKGLKSLE
jgi:hypothetical protein